MVIRFSAYFFYEGLIPGCPGEQRLLVLVMHTEFNG